MALEVTKVIQQKLVYPSKGGYTNLIGMVEWSIIFNVDGIESIASINTMLNTDSVVNFKPIEELADDEIIAMCLVHEGGEGFVDMLLEQHAPVIEYRRMMSQLEPYVG